MARALESGLLAVALALAALMVTAAFQHSEPLSPPSSVLSALRRDPLNLQALRTEALAAAAAGQSSRATRMLEFVASQTRRDGPTDAWLLRDRLARGDIPGALACADALLRLDPEGKTRPVLFALLAAAVAYVEARPPLAQRLSENPWWRQDFLQYLGTHGDPAAATSLFSDLAAGPHPGQPVEYAPLIDRLVAARDYDGAVDAWRQAAPRLAGGAGALRDGDFAQAWDHSPFTWRPADGVGATSEARDQVDGPVRRALRIDYDGFGAPSLPAQLLVLPPGRWRLDWRVRAGIQADQRLYWRLRCADSGKVLAGAAGGDVAPPDPGWRSQRLTFETPAGGCRGQWLELIAVPGERRASVSALYADFRLQATP